MGVDRVGERVDALPVGLVPLHGDLERHALTLGPELDHRLVDRGLGLVEVAHEVGDAALVAEGDLALLGVGAVDRALVAQRDGQAPVEEGHLLQPAVDRLEVEHGRLEDLRVRPERHRRAGLAGRLALGHLRGRLGIRVRLAPDEPVLVDHDLDPGGQRVDHGDAHAVQATGDRVGLAVELAARVQRGQRDLDGRLLLHRGDVHRDAAAVIDHPDPAVGEQRDLDRVAEAGERLVDGVVHDLLDEVVQATLAGRADVHAGTLADRLQTLEYRDRRRVVVTRLLLRRCHPRSLSPPRAAGSAARAGGRAPRWVAGTP